MGVTGLDGEEAQRLYALALSLVPEANAAGDLFLAARDERDLRRRAARWRRQHGLPPAPAEPAAELPALDAEQQAYALHLAGRKARRRAQRPWLLGAGAALLAGALTLARFTVLAAPTGLAADRHFRGAPAATSAPVAGMRLMVYRAEATAGTVTLWWEVQGPGASRLSADLAVRLFGQGPGGRLPQRETVQAAPFGPGADLWRQPVRQETAAVRGDRLLGRSVFRLVGLGRDSVLLGVHRLADPGYDWSLQVPLTRVEPDPAARVLSAGQQATVGGATLTLETVTVAPDYLAVRYTLPATVGRGLTRGGVVALAGEQRLSPYGFWRRDDGSVQAVFDPPPPGERRLTILFAGLGFLYEPAVIPLPAPDLLSQWQQTGDQVTALLTLPPGQRVAVGLTFLTDDEGRRYNVTLRPAQQHPGSLQLQASGVPPGAHLVSLSIGYLQRVEPPSFSVTLPG